RASSTPALLTPRVPESDSHLRVSRRLSNRSVLLVIGIVAFGPQSPPAFAPLLALRLQQRAPVTCPCPCPSRSRSTRLLRLSAAQSRRSSRLVAASVSGATPP